MTQIVCDWKLGGQQIFVTEKISCAIHWTTVAPWICEASNMTQLLSVNVVFVAKMIMSEEGGIRALEADHEELSS